MNYNYEERCVTLGKYIAQNRATVRKTAEVFNISKSTVHIDVTKRLSVISPALQPRFTRFYRKTRRKGIYAADLLQKKSILHIKKIDI